jgi:hypothetical protein
MKVAGEAAMGFLPILLSTFCHDFVTRHHRHIVKRRAKKNAPGGALPNPASRSRSFACPRSTLVAACSDYNNDIL